MADTPSRSSVAAGKPDVDASRTEYRLSDQIGYLLRRAYQRHLAIFQEHVGDHVTSVQFSTLCTLRDRGPMSQAELVAATAIDQATIRGILDRLRARGFVALGRDPADGRKVSVSVTAAGLRTLEEMIPVAERVTELTYGDLNPAERTALDFVLRKISGDAMVA